MKNFLVGPVPAPSADCRRTDGRRDGERDKGRRAAGTWKKEGRKYMAVGVSQRGF